uniref:Disease resistance N-terminal domain-containing protein n=1 Tax=Setaria viridis TaxID=4556 RepID=A0A4U6TL66_SETVI|nr:disease resistance protein Pik-2-like [Setaria viridis]TKW01805.1 hypothetical protein SEVIR_8G202766v2 [Setaria viridis]
MEVVTGALPSVITKLGELLIGEYNLQKGVKGEIRFLQSELQSMQGALEKVSNTPADQLEIEDKIWARNLRELSYYIEDSIDTFMVRGKCNEQANLHGITKFIDRSVGLFRKAKIRHGIATEIRDIKSRVEEVAKRHDRYKLSNSNVAKHVPIDPRLLYQYDKVTELVGIEEARDEIIRILMEGNEVSKQQDKIISIVGFGGLATGNLKFAECNYFAECIIAGTRRRTGLPSVILKTLGKNITLGKEPICRVPPKKHSANTHRALGKD